ncbi:MAG: MmgE/PrpD family protein [Burkholderiales bacterium]
MSNPLQAIAEWVTGPSVQQLPHEGVVLIKRAFLDTIAVTLLGSRLEGPRIVAALEQERGGQPQASVVGMKAKTDVIAAALINGTSAHAELFDDNNGPMIAHPSAPLVSALLPLAQHRGATGRELIEAYTAGFEISVKLGRMLNPKFYEQGWHVTRVLGVFGATAACCRLLHLDVSRTSAALGIAASMASGIRQNFGTMTMGLHVGLTARDALHATMLAERGFGADPSALHGKYGFFPVYGNQNPALLPLGAPFELLASGIIFKLYPSGAPTLAAVDAAVALHKRLRGDVSRVKRITCLVHPWNAMTLRDEEPRDPLQAKVNLRYCVAAALRDGELTYRHFSAEGVADAGLADLRRRIDVRISADLPDNNEFPAEVDIELEDGTSISERRDVPQGGATLPLTQDQIEAKLRSCAEVALRPHAVERLIEQTRRLESLQDIGSLCAGLEGDS